MRLNFKKHLAVAVTLLCFSNVSLAGEVVCDANTSYDYGDATGYSEACHATNNWQQLGENPQQLAGDNRAANNDDSWTSETTQNSVDVGDNGVTWRVQNPVDLSWSAFGNEALIAGANVEFQFVVTRSNQGNHEFDQLKAWGDWNDNGVFDDSEKIMDQKWYKVANSFADKKMLGNQLGGWNNDPLVNGGTTDSIRNSGITSDILTVSYTIPVEAHISETWIRARIICENSLTDEDRMDEVFLATGYYHQGEVEDYKVAVTSVPEPTTLFVFGSALIGLVLSRKKTK